MFINALATQKYMVAMDFFAFRARITWLCAHITWLCGINFFYISMSKNLIFKINPAGEKVKKEPCLYCTTPGHN